MQFTLLTIGGTPYPNKNFQPYMMGFFLHQNFQLLFKNTKTVKSIYTYNFWMPEFFQVSSSIPGLSSVHNLP